MNRVGIVIVAGGSGSRMGSEIPKQFIVLNGKPILMHTINRFREALPQAEIVVVLPEKEIPSWASLCETYSFTTEHTVIPGGKTRFHSVKKGLGLLGETDYIGVHDGVRPVISSEIIRTVLECAQKYGAAIPVTEITDSLREIKACASCEDPIQFIESKIVDRNRFRAVQTPQFFRSQILLKAYGQDYIPQFTDDASVVEAHGNTVTLCPGDYRNIKVTTPADLVIAELFLRGENPA